MRVARAFLTTAAVVCLIAATPVPTAYAQSTPPVAAAAAPVERTNYQAAADYNAAHDGYSMLVLKDGVVIFEAYANGGAADKAHELASGTKSFSGAMAIAAQQDGLLSLDEKVSDTITEWQADPRKATITIRQLLTLTSGLGGGALGRPPAYADAIAKPLESDPGTKFSYGPDPFQVFGEVMRRKLVAAGTGDATPLDYLKRRIFAPAGIAVGSWKHGRDGMPHLPSGARLTAREWAKFGQLILDDGKAADGTQVLPADELPTLVEGTDLNRNYGLTFWLMLDPEDKLKDFITAKPRGGKLGEWLAKRRAAKPSTTAPPVETPADAYMAAGMGKQRLYMMPSLGMVVVRQGNLRSKDFRDGEFLSLLLAGETP